ncbi:MAG: hypothetical protein COV47_02250 [Candidatus Diapherotrites archaeon CG11_big_fil_rev_8_21_14_0_20_37_9]|nr:MAG: hypothetical protein COV47_02250 [Candidatus Diapherotrites archaeon CG11_big_fil_rev_8_21_14_0_20_37_9]
MRQMNLSNIEQGELVVADIIFAEQDAKKRRLALVISGTEYNRTSTDIIVLKVTSSARTSKYHIRLTNDSTIKKALKKNSKIVADFPVTITKQKILSRPDRITKEKLQETKERMEKLYNI